MFERTDFMVEEEEESSVEAAQPLKPLPRIIKRKEAVRLLFPKHYRSYPHIAAGDTNQFCRLFNIGVYCIVLDVNFQMIGSYDNYLQQFYPGLKLVPPYLRKHTHKDMEGRRGGGLVEIEFSLLPCDAFMIVPVLYDECVSQTDGNEDVLYSEEIKFRCDLYTRQLVDIKDYSPSLVIDSGADSKHFLLFVLSPPVVTESLCDGVNSANNDDIFISDYHVLRGSS